MLMAMPKLIFRKFQTKALSKKEEGRENKVDKIMVDQNVRKVEKA